jgi:hypothetical protein
MDGAFSALLALGHNKGEILAGQLYAQTLRKHGQIADALALSTQLEPYRKSTLLELLSYVTIVEKEEDTNAEPTSPGDGMDSSRGAAPESRMEPDTAGIQKPVSYGNMETGRIRSSNVRPDEQHPEQVSQSTLW